MNAIKRVVMLLILVSHTSGCAGLIVASALDRNASRKERQVEYIHRERMRELDIREREMLLRMRQDNTITRSNPY